MTQPSPARSFAAKNLLVSHLVITAFMVFNVVLGGYLKLQNAPRSPFSERTDLVLLAILTGTSLVGIVSNAVFVIGQCLALRQRAGGVTWNHQMLILMALIPWIGWRFFDKLKSVDESASQSPPKPHSPVA